VPLLVGGTMLYFRALNARACAAARSGPQVARRRSTRARRAGWPALHAELRRLDPQRPRRIRRTMRSASSARSKCIELTGERSPICSSRRCRRRSRSRGFALAAACRERLYARIERRFDEMLAAGFVDEVRALHARGDLHRNCPACAPWDTGRSGHVTWRSVALERPWRARQATRNLAKRQLTWLRATPACMDKFA
jgi:tRNA dimethylallyltransferase